MNRPPHCVNCYSTKLTTNNGQWVCWSCGELAATRKEFDLQNAIKLASTSLQNTLETLAEAERVLSMAQPLTQTQYNAIALSLGSEVADKVLEALR